MQIKLDEYERPHRLAFSINGDRMDMHWTFTFSPDATRNATRSRSRAAAEGRHAPDVPTHRADDAAHVLQAPGSARRRHRRAALPAAAGLVLPAATFVELHTINPNKPPARPKPSTEPGQGHSAASAASSATTSTTTTTTAHTTAASPAAKSPQTSSTVPAKWRPDEKPHPSAHLGVRPP